jgi:hypothetical protein
MYVQAGDACPIIFVKIQICIVTNMSSKQRKIIIFRAPVTLSVVFKWFRGIDFVRKMSDEVVRVRMTSRTKGMLWLQNFMGEIS